MRMWESHTVNLRAEFSSTRLSLASRPLLVKAAGNHSCHPAIWARVHAGLPTPLSPSHSGHLVFAVLFRVRHRAGDRMSNPALQGRQGSQGSHQIKPTPKGT